MLGSTNFSHNFHLRLTKVQAQHSRVPCCMCHTCTMYMPLHMYIIETGYVQPPNKKNRQYFGFAGFGQNRQIFCM